MTDIAKRDPNYVTGMMAVSSVDGETPVSLYADPVTHRLLVQQNVLTGTEAPSSTPTSVGQLFVDTVAKKLYFAAGTTNSSDWIIVN
jgi:hypothetical protein